MSIVMHHVTEASPSIQLTESAKKHLLGWLSKNPGHMGARFSVGKTGCSGLSYKVDYVQQVNKDDLVIPLEGDFHIYIDKGSYVFLKDMQVDYVKQGLIYKFIFNNPNQTGQCGCGESFTVG